MTVLFEERLPISVSEDVVLARQAVRRLCASAGFSIVDQTKLVTAASEIARNVLDHGGGGEARLERLENNGRQGVRCIFEDHGRGIPDIQLAMRDGYSTAGGLGLGLSGAKRLVNEFEIASEAGKGTRVSLLRWR